MKVFGLQGEIMRSARLADKVFDDPEGDFSSPAAGMVRAAAKAAWPDCVDQAAEILGVSRATLYRWCRRLSEAGIQGLRSRSRRPRRVRRRPWARRAPYGLKGERPGTWYRWMSCTCTGSRG